MKQQFKFLEYQKYVAIDNNREDGENRENK